MSDLKIPEQNSECLLGKSNIEFDFTYSLPQSEARYNRESSVSAFSQSPLIGSLSNLQVTRTGIKSHMSSNLCRVGLFTMELFALEHSH